MLDLNFHARTCAAWQRGVVSTTGHTPTTVFILRPRPRELRGCADRIAGAGPQSVKITAREIGLPNLPEAP